MGKSKVAFIAAQMVQDGASYACQRSSSRERGERTGAFLRDLEDYGEEFELHSEGDQRPLEVFVQSDDKTRII